MSGKYDYLRGTDDLRNLPVLLRALNASFEEVENWKTRKIEGDRVWDCEWVVNHHTANPHASGHESLNWLTYGGLPGVSPPYSHALVGREPKIFLIAAGRANHAGRGGPFKNVPKDSMNAYSYGIEVEAPGRALDFAPGQFELMCKLNAAVLWIVGRPVDRVIRHKDWTDGGVDGVPWLPTRGRKIDVRYSLDSIRATTRAYVTRLEASTTPTPPKPPAKPVVYLDHILKAIKKDGPAPTGHTTYKSEVLIVEQALNKQGLLAKAYVDGSAGTVSFGDKSAYQKWQVQCGYTGKDADGIPGMASLSRLGRKYGFQVK
jgi:N-acetylmuramoyl-L-alanine amidase